jgi:hypothetical protein
LYSGILFSPGSPEKLKQKKMKTTLLNARPKKILIGILTVMIMLPFSLYAQKIPFLQSSNVPAAEGYVKVKTDRNNNYVIKIRIKNLAEIEKLDPSKQTYVVWMDTESEATKNIGRINSSNSLKVSFESVSAFQPIKIFITAEEDESTQEPNWDTILTTENFWEDK